MAVKVKYAAVVQSKKRKKKKSCLNQTVFRHTEKPILNLHLKVMLIFDTFPILLLVVDNVVDNSDKEKDTQKKHRERM